MRQVPVDRVQARAKPARRVLDSPYRRGAHTQRVGGSLKRREGALLGVRPVRQLCDQIQKRGQHRDRRLVVVDRRPVLLAADRDRPQRSGEQFAGCRAGSPRVEVQVVPVGAEHAGERVRRVADVDLDPVEPTFEKAVKEIDPAQLAAELARRPAGRQLELDQRLLLASDQMMVVIARQEYEPLALELLAHHLEQPVGGAERVSQRREQEVEHVSEEDDLVDVEVRLEERDRVPVAQDVLARPGAEVRVRENERAHPRAARPSPSRSAQPCKPTTPRVKRSGPSCHARRPAGMAGLDRLLFSVRETAAGVAGTEPIPLDR